MESRDSQKLSLKDQFSISSIPETKSRNSFKGDKAAQRTNTLDQDLVTSLESLTQDKQPPPLIYGPQIGYP